jgi:hypothetical protein
VRLCSEPVPDPANAKKLIRRAGSRAGIAYCSAFVVAGGLRLRLDEIGLGRSNDLQNQPTKLAAQLLRG